MMGEEEDEKEEEDECNSMKDILLNWQVVMVVVVVVDHNNLFDIPDNMKFKHLKTSVGSSYTPVLNYCVGIVNVFLDDRYTTFYDLEYKSMEKVPVCRREEENLK
uniref:Uncharacterized protein n=1 Tax=Glossina brevipalpis TaxID=37001 RepID=A0A1A9WM53_9MUSC